MDAESKLAIDWLGLRSPECAEAFAADLTARLAGRMQFYRRLWRLHECREKGNWRLLDMR